MKRLAAYAALVAVPRLIVGIYGMNFDYMPQLRWRHGYAAVLTVMATIDGCPFYRLRARSGCSYVLTSSASTSASDRNSPSHFDTTAVAMLLPMTLVAERPMSRK